MQDKVEEGGPEEKEKGGNSLFKIGEEDLMENIKARRMSNKEAYLKLLSSTKFQHLIPSLVEIESNRHNNLYYGIEQSMLKIGEENPLLGVEIQNFF